MIAKTCFTLTMFGLALAGGCVESGWVIEYGGGGAGPKGPGSGGGVPHDPRLDLLLVVDNSIGMAASQERLASELEVLLRWLAEPPCLTPSGTVFESATVCPEGSARAFSAVRDLHLGVITSSLGDLTSGACQTVAIPNDEGRLITRLRGGGLLPTYQDQGFLVFDPDGRRTPRGEVSLEAFIGAATGLVLGAQSTGCGYEMPLEAMTRFLVDPAPYGSLQQNAEGLLDRVGIDDAVLAERENFLRDTSNLAIVILSNENDCSVDPASQGFRVLQPGPFYRATSICEGAPYNECCTSCNLNDDPACDPEASCTSGPNGSNRYFESDDPANISCFDQKRRYGIDFLFPTVRYENALSLSLIDASSSTLTGPDLVQNPLFKGGRRPEQISLHAVVGVPWQDLVENPSDPRSRTLNSTELEQTARWDWVTGEHPLDPFAEESLARRKGQNPATHDEVSIENPINGGDLFVRDQLQSACIFPLPEPVEFGESCSGCGDDDCLIPICDGTTQTGSFALPATRTLEVIRGLRERGSVDSACRDPEAHGTATAIVARLSKVLP